jgi:hypothetical protein
MTAETRYAVRPMEGHGAYNQDSRVQAAGLRPVVALLEEAARTAPLAPASEAIVVADYGASAGRNSIQPIGAAIAELRRRIGPDRAINVVHTDLPDNDFSALFATLATEPDSYLATDRAAFALAIGRSYFGQILPTGSVSLGWSSWAIQWLSRVPALIPDQLQAIYSRDAAAREATFLQAAADWRTFLACRSRELKAGGRLVIVTMASDNNGDFGYAPLLDAMYAALRDLVGDGLVSEEEFRGMVIPTVGRSKAEFEAPFANGGRFEGLSLNHLEIFPGEDRIWTAFETNRDAGAVGAGWARFARGAVFPTLASALQGADAARQAQFYDRYEAGIAARLAKSPVKMAIPLAKMVVVKES